MFSIFLYICAAKVTVEIQGNLYAGDSLDDAVSQSPIPHKELTVLNVISGSLNEADFITNSETITQRYPNLVTFFTSQETILPIKIPDNSFYNHSNLENVSIYGSTSFGDNEFMECKSLLFINCSNVHSIGYLCFFNCFNIETIYLPSLSVVPDSGFYNLKSLQFLSLDSASSVGPYAFEACKNLSILFAPNLVNLSVFTFSQCQSFQTLNFSESFPLIRFLPRQCFFACTSLTSIDIGNVEYIGYECFGNCLNLQTFIGNSVINISSRDQYSPFNNCTNLTSVSLIRITALPDNLFTSHPNLQHVICPEVTTLGMRIFYDCTSLSEISLPKLKSGSNGIFTNTKIKSINFPQCTSLVASSFESATFLEIAELPSLESVTKKLFKNCTSLRKVILTNALTLNIDAFLYCYNLEEIDLSSMNDSIPNDAFSSCSKLERISISKATSIYSNAFNGCSKLKELDLSNAIEFIGDSIFANCTLLTKVILTSLQSVDIKSANLFQNCPSFKEIHLPSYPPQVFNESTFIQRNSSETMNLILPSQNDYIVYDNDLSVPGDKPDDHMWCSIPLIYSDPTSSFTITTIVERTTTKSDKEVIEICLISGCVLLGIICAFVIFLVFKKKQTKELDQVGMTQVLINPDAVSADSLKSI